VIDLLSVIGKSLDFQIKHFFITLEV